MGTAVTYEKPSDLTVVGAMVKGAKQIIVVDQDTYDNAVEYMKDWKARRDVIEAKRVQYVTPLNELKAAIQADFTPVIEDYDAAIRIVKATAITWVKEQERIQREKQAEDDRIAREAREAAEKAAAKLERKNPEAAAALRESAAVITAPIAAPAFVAAKGASTRKTWKGKVVDAQAFLAHVAAHPEFMAAVEFKQIELNRIAALYKNAVKVPGLDLYEDTGMAV